MARMRPTDLSADLVTRKQPVDQVMICIGGSSEVEVRTIKRPNRPLDQRHRFRVTIGALPGSFQVFPPVRPTHVANVKVEFHSVWLWITEAVGELCRSRSGFEQQRRPVGRLHSLFGMVYGRHTWQIGSNILPPEARPYVE